MLRAITSSLKWKFVTLMIIVISITVSVIGFFSYWDTSKTLQADIQHFSEQILKQANLNLSSYYQQYEQGFLLLGTSDEVRDWMRLSPEDTMENAFTYYKIKDNYILPLMSRYSEILSISLLSDQGNEIHVENGYTRLIKDYSLQHEPWTHNVLQDDRLHVEVGISHNYLTAKANPTSMLVMSMVKQLGRVNNGMIKMDIALEPVQGILRQIDLGQTGVSLVSDASNRIIVHPDDSLITTMLPAQISDKIQGQDNGWFFLEGSQEMVIFETIQSNKWKTIAIIPYDEMNKSIIRIRNVTIITAVVALLLSVLLVISLTSSVTNRLTKLRQIIRSTKTGNIEVRAPVKGSDEVTDLSIAYNQMLDRLDGTVHELADLQVKQEQAAMKAMQSQINSHFLYNTLETINSMANLVNHKEIEMTAINLSKMLRYAANYERTLVALREEVNHTMRYLEICKLRFNDQISFTFDIEESCQDLLCLKAILQPIVENSLRHGIEKTGEPMHICITARQKNPHLHIQVTDNGPGYSQEALMHLQAKLAIPDVSTAFHELSRIGLLNVHYRICMYDQHADSGLSISNNDAGASTEIRMLLRTQEEVKGR
jgi:two-component system sensor histidine kinase YesM